MLIVETRLGPGDAISGPISYTLPENFPGGLSLAWFEALSGTAILAPASTPVIRLVIRNRSGLARWVAGTPVLSQGGTPFFSFGPAGYQNAAAVGIEEHVAGMPRLPLLGGDVLRLEFSGGGGADQFDTALATVSYGAF